jgi:unsaturated rhamnogalacturonyl hydrolase
MPQFYRRVAFWIAVMSVATTGDLIGRQVPGVQQGATVLGEIESIAAVPGEPRVVSAAGVARSETRLLTLENSSAFENATQRRLVLVGGLDGDLRGSRAVMGAVKWFKTSAPASVRQRWSVSALPLGDPDKRSLVRPFQFPPEKGFYDDPEQPEARYVWRWAAFQAPDLIVEVRGGDALVWETSPLPRLGPPKASPGSLAAAASQDDFNALGPVPAAIAIAGENDGERMMKDLLSAADGLGRSKLHAALLARVSRSPLDASNTLARRYPETPSISYIPATSWANTLRLASIVNDDALRTKVQQQTAPWVSGGKPLFGEKTPLTTVAGTLIFAELARRNNDQAARALAIAGAEAALLQRSDGMPQNGQGWTDDMFMSASILARTGQMPGRQSDLDRAANIMVDYAGRLQRADGIFVHATNGPHAWGRGNGFAALGLTEVLTALPASHPMRSRVLDVYRRHMAGLLNAQAPDGMWRQVVDEPGAYREQTVTAMVLSAMARGRRLGWLDQTYAPVIERAWRGLLAHITEDGGVVDVCTGTGAGPTKRYYLDRAAISGPDDRGGAMALLAAMEVHELSGKTR